MDFHVVDVLQNTQQLEKNIRSYTYFIDLSTWTTTF